MSIKVKDINMTIDDCIRYGLIDETLAQAIEDHIKEEVGMTEAIHEEEQKSYLKHVRSIAETLTQLQDKAQSIIDDMSEENEDGEGVIKDSAREYYWAMSSLNKALTSLADNVNDSVEGE